MSFMFFSNQAPQQHNTLHYHYLLTIQKRNTFMCFSPLLLLSGKHSDLETSRVDDNDLPPRPMVETSYDKLDFSRPAAELKPHYHSTSTLKSVKSTSVSKSRDEGDGGLLEGVQNSSKMPISTNSSGYIQTALFTDPSTRRASSGHLCHNTNSRVSYLCILIHLPTKN